MLLKIEGVSKSYGKKKALTDFSYSFENGVYAVLGPNGAGKSTLFNILTCNLKQDEGRVLWQGKDIRTHKDEYLANIGFIPQQQDIYRGFTFERFLWYMASLKGIKNNDAKTEVKKVAEAVNLSGDLNRKLGAFSRGMKQRALIAQALLGSPGILICDEPTAGLDPKERISFRELVMEYGKNALVIIATHIVPDVENIAKEVVFLKEGRIAAAGDPNKLCKNTEHSHGIESELEAFYMSVNS